MLSLHFKRALQDIRHNRLLNAVTITTIALSILIVSAAILFFVNTTDMLEAWRRGIRIMVYLEDGLDQTRHQAIATRLEGLYGVQEARFISKQTALERLHDQMPRQSAILEGLGQNPLPDAFEVQMIPTARTWEKAEDLARRLEAGGRSAGVVLACVSSRRRLRRAPKAFAGRASRHRPPRASGRDLPPRGARSSLVRCRRGSRRSRRRDVRPARSRS